MRKSLVLIISVAAVAGIFSASQVWTDDGSSSNQEAVTDDGVGISPQPMGARGTPTESKHRANMDEWKTTQDEFESADVARKSASFSFKVPDAASLPPLQGFYIDRKQSLDEFKIVRSIYGDAVDGISFKARLTPVTDEAKVAEAYESHVKDINSFPHREVDYLAFLTINGHPATSGMPAKYDESDELHRAAFVEWWDSGIEYRLTGSRGDSPTSVEELVAIAETVR